MRSLTLCVIMCWFSAGAFAQWSPDGNAISVTPGANRPRVISDGAGGAIIVWQQVGDIYAQRIDSNGVALWTAGGVIISNHTAFESNPTLISDNAGGAIITWQNPNGFRKILAQRVNANGIVQWSANGVVVCPSALNPQANPVIISDNAGGAIIAWNGTPNAVAADDIWAQRVDASGALMWPTLNGIGVAVCTAVNHQMEPKITGDNVGGAIITWEDARTGMQPSAYGPLRVYAQRINASGVVQWITDGVAISSTAGQQRNPQIASDNAGGAIITSEDGRNGLTSEWDIYAQRIDPSGTFLWTTDGVAISTEASYQLIPQIVSDNAGGAIIAWEDYRTLKPHIYAQHINKNAVVQWTTDGVTISDVVNNQLNPQIASDNAGGAIMTWLQRAPILDSPIHIFAQRINTNGVVKWKEGGVAICTAPVYYPDLTIAGDTQGGAIIAWTDLRNNIDPNRTSNTDIYAQRISGSRLQITNHQKRKLWVAGEKHVITWTSSGIDSVNIFYAANFKTEPYGFTEIIHAYPADSREYVWEVPDILSYRSAILIVDSKDAAVRDTSEVFRIKGYVLTRVTPDSTYEAFDPAVHGWSFGNYDGIDFSSDPPNLTNAIMWPLKWWVQFDYGNGKDPFTGQKYPAEWPYWPIAAMPNHFPDWPLFVHAFGINQAYWPYGIGGPFLRYRPTAVSKWAWIKSIWRGSCFGFATSALLAFDDPTAFKIRYPGVGSASHLFQLDITDYRRALINELQAYCLTSAQVNYQNANRFKPLDATLNELKQMLLDENRNDRVLYFKNKESKLGAHAVIPYKLEQASIDLWKIYVYDSNAPGDASRHIAINTQANFWFYGAMDWTGTTMLFLMDPVRNYLQNPDLSQAARWEEQSVAARFQDNNDQKNNYIQFYNTSEAATLITNATGKTIGYANGLAFNNLDDGIPIIPITGSLHPPIGYYLPNGAYSIQMAQFPDSLAHLAVLANSVIYSWSRTDAKGNQTDRFTFNSGLAVSNHDGQSKSANLQIIAIEETSERVFDIAKLNSLQGDSLYFNLENQNDLKLVNSGAVKAYDLRLRAVSANAELFFEHHNIHLTANASHRIVPNWGNLEKEPVQILIDVDNNGIPDNTLYVSNEIGGQQLVADAGADKGIHLGESVTLGGNPTASGGSGSYTYSWAPKTGLLDPATNANPRAHPLNTTTYTVTVTDANGRQATDQVTITVQKFVFLSNGIVKINQNEDSKGDIHANGKIEFGKGKPGTHIGNLEAVDDIKIEDKNTIQGNATAGDELYLLGNAKVTGAKTAHAAVSKITLPKLSYTAGGANVTIAANTSKPLAPGSYGTVSVKTKATLLLSAGDYYMNMLGTDPNAIFSINAAAGPVNIYVVSDLEFDNNVQVKLTGGTSDNVLFASLQKHKIDIGTGVVIYGTLINPNAEVHFSNNSKIKGAVYAASITLDPKVKFYHHTSLGTFPKEDEAADNEQPVTSYELAQNYPNPFNPSTTIQFSVLEAGVVQLSVYNINGQEVRTLVSEQMNTGRHAITWDGKDNAGQVLPSGVYLYKLRVNGFVQTRKMIFMK